MERTLIQPERLSLPDRSWLEAGRAREFMDEDMYMVLSWVQPERLLSMCTRFIFQSQTTRTFICGRLFLPKHSLCLPLVVNMHNVPSITKRAPGIGASIILHIMHTCFSYGGKQITSLEREKSSSTTMSA